MKQWKVWGHAALPKRKSGRLLVLFVGLGVLSFCLVNSVLALDQQEEKKEKAEMVVAAPVDASWVTKKEMFLAGMVVGAEVKQVSIKGVRSKAGDDHIPVEGGAFGTLITLSEGENTIVLVAGNLKKTIRVYYAPGKNGPKGYKRFYTHSNPEALSCKECHKQRKGQFDPRKISPTRANCTIGKCHGGMGKAAHVHGPVGAGVCISCHSPHGSTNPMSLERTGAELCVVCHQGKKEEFSQGIMHAPVKEGCVSCHNPHESPMRFQLRGNGASVSSLCFNCHEAPIFTKEHRHGPVGSGDCIACHRPHNSTFKHLLIASPEKGEVCFQCHKDRKEEFTMKYVHKPVTENCNQCHDPHSSKARYQLHKDGGELCASCHKKLSPKVYSAIEKAVVKHKPVDQGRCTDCHRAHSSNVKSLLKNSTEKLCFSCHEELGDEVAGSKHRHGPVQTGDCMSCHQVHGGQFANLFVRYFPKEFYKDYSPENYDLCFGCHNKDVAKKKFTKELTNFRDGEYNLHFFHVNSKKGRNCVACHNAHASNQPKHIRYEVPFGAWSYPISLTKTPTGGTCVVGCHAPKSYDREKPHIKQPSSR